MCSYENEKQQKVSDKCWAQRSALKRLKTRFSRKNIYKGEGVEEWDEES